MTNERQLIESYRMLVGTLLEHTTLHEGTDEAMADCISSDDRAEPILSAIVDAQREDQKVASDS